MLENEDVLYSQSNQMANKTKTKKPSQIKEQFQGKDRIQGGPITSLIKTSERHQVAPPRSCQIDKTSSKDLMGLPHRPSLLNNRTFETLKGIF